MQIGTRSGCIITTQFTMPGNQKKQNGEKAGEFANYLDYITRNEAVQKYSTDNKLVNDYSGYLEYMSNEYKTITANAGKAVEDMEAEDYKVIFTADKDNLTKEEYSKVKEAFNMAEQNGSPLWETVISFDMKWIEQFHLYDSETKYVDDKKVREFSRKCMRTILEAEDMTESAIWTGDIHYNTDNLHIHIATVEPVPTRKIMIKDGHEEFRGKWKMSSIDKGRSAVVNSIMDNAKTNELINKVIRKDIIEDKKQHPINQDPELCNLFFDIYEKLKPIDKLQWKYSNNVLKPVRPLINELSRQYINKYHAEDYKKLIDMLQEQEQKYSLAYGNGEKTKNEYAKNKIEDLYKRLGNTIIKEMSNYDRDMNKTVIDSIDFQEKDIENYAENNEINENIEIEVFSSNISSQNSSWWSDEYKLARKKLYGTLEEKPDVHMAFKLMESEAKKGNGYAMHDLGKMTLSGLGCEKDEIKANEWFRCAHDSFIEAEATTKKPGYLQYRIGKLYAMGYGVEKDYQQAANWYNKAVRENNTFAAYALGTLYNRGDGVEKNEERAFELFEIAASDELRPNGYAQYELGKMCMEGKGTEINIQKSEEWFKCAYNEFEKIIHKNQADDKLYYRLGQMNILGVGTEKNYDKAEFYLKKAEELKNVDALYSLGKLYMNEEFERYNANKAIKYLESSIYGGNKMAKYTLGKFLITGDKEIKNVALGMEYLEGSASEGSQYAQYQLGKIYLFGKEVKRDYEKAVKYLRAAAEQGNVSAKKLLEESKNINQMRKHPRDILHNRAATGGNTLKAIYGINRTINGLKDAMKSTKEHAINQYIYEMMQRALDEGKSMDEAMQIPNSYINRDR